MSKFRNSTAMEAWDITIPGKSGNSKYSEVSMTSEHSTLRLLSLKGILTPKKCDATKWF